MLYILLGFCLPNICFTCFNFCHSAERGGKKYRGRGGRGRSRKGPPEHLRSQSAAPDLPSISPSREDPGEEERPAAPRAPPPGTVGKDYFTYLKQLT